MHTFAKTPTRMKITGAALAMAALLIALLAAVLTAGNAQAQRIPTPEGCGPEITPVADGGSIALFDAYWDPHRKILVNNPCPPHIEHTTETEFYQDSKGDWHQREVEVSTRSTSNVNIGQTIFHVPQRAMRTLTTDDDDPWDVDDYGFLGDAGDRVWILPGENTDLLRIGFSAALLNPEDWDGDSGTGSSPSSSLASARRTGARCSSSTTRTINLETRKWSGAPTTPTPTSCR